MYTAVIIIAIVVIVVQLQVVALKAKIGELSTENGVLKSSIEREHSKLLLSLSDIERSIEIIEDNINRLKEDEIHEINDDIKHLKSWLRNVGEIATSKKDGANSVRG